MNVLLVGHGYWGKKIAKTLEKFQDLQLFIYDKAENNLTLDAFLVQIPDFNHVFIVTPEQTHYELVKKFLLLGKNVFVEKPLCLEKKQAEELVNLAIKNKVTLFVDYIFLYDSFAKKIKEILDSKILGKIKNISTTRSSSFVNKPDLLVTDDLMIHDLYLLKYFFASKVADLSFESSLDSSLKQADFSISLTNKIKVEASYSWIDPKSTREMTFYGDEGTLFWIKNESLEEVVVIKNNNSETVSIKNNQSPLFSSIEDFFNQVSGSNQRYNDYINDVEFLSLARTNFYENKSF